MPKLSVVFTILLAALLAACGGPAAQNGGGEASGPTATPVVLATPTPRPAPPTPTPRPTVAPVEPEAETDTEPEAEESAATEEEATEEEAEEQAPAEEEAAASAPAEDMVEVPAGTYTIGLDGGKPKNAPAHEVELDAFLIDRFEVTMDEFAQFAEATGYTTYAEEQGSRSWRDIAEDRGNHPVTFVTWEDAAAYCEWATKRLPTEEEWEAAARGTEAWPYPWGTEYPGEEEISTYGNLYETGLRSTFAVGAFPDGVSPYGAHDMLGNVREWTASDFDAYPGQDPEADQYFGQGTKVHRGGGWFDGLDGEVATTYNRNHGPPETSASDDLGFRCARDAES